MQEKKVLCGGEESSSLYAYAHLIHVTLVEPLSRPFHSVILLLPFGKARRVWEGRDDGMGWCRRDARARARARARRSSPHLTMLTQSPHLNLAWSWSSTLATYEIQQQLVHNPIIPPTSLCFACLNLTKEIRFRTTSLLGAHAPACRSATGEWPNLHALIEYSITPSLPELSCSVLF